MNRFVITAERMDRSIAAILHHSILAWRLLHHAPDDPQAPVFDDDDSGCDDAPDGAAARPQAKARAKGKIRVKAAKAVKAVKAAKAAKAKGKSCGKEAKDKAKAKGKAAAEAKAKALIIKDGTKIATSKSNGKEQKRDGLGKFTRGDKGDGKGDEGASKS